MSLLDEGRVEDLNTFHAWLMKAVERGPVAVITGKNGDMDTVGSAVALASSHPHLMACGLHLGRVAKRMVEHHRAPFRKLTPNHRAWPPDLAGLIVVDAAAESQTGLTLPDVPKCILDHLLHLKFVNFCSPDSSPILVVSAMQIMGHFRLQAP